MPVWSASSPSSCAGSPASSIAWRVATSAIWVVRSLRRISLRSSTVGRVEVEHLARERAVHPDGSNEVMVRTPDSPATSPDQKRLDRGAQGRDRPHARDDHPSRLAHRTNLPVRMVAAR